ncbi:MAG TPA: efflux RND transporter periplasmic adaptor subunit [Puia sp.]|jgi:Cu(I)/Ag(I) efflux system membrane fusion protein|nr:efflux RND transporter periplasmic adaptor subunit [Puia sp.]
MKYILAIGMIFIFGACKTKNKESAQTSDTYYTCSMHPQIMEEKAGKCPICGMTLIAVKKSQGQVDNTLMLSDQQVQLGNIQVDTIGNGKIGNTTVLNASLTIDETKSSAISSRVAGRIDKLYFKNTGEYIKKGDRLYDLYSESLNNAKQEYILALEKSAVLDQSIIDFKQLTESARNKLLLWGMTADQIALLEKTKQASPLTTFYSTASGVLTSFEIHEGEYIPEGGTVVRLSDLSSLWAQAQVYTSQLSDIDAAGKAVVQIPDIGKEISGRIELVNPEINPDTRINLVRVAIQNKNDQLKPGMLAYVVLTNRPMNTLTLPLNAVLRNEHDDIVWVQSGHNAYKRVSVKLGKEYGENVEIISGIKPGDIIVVNGAYLINSEYIFKKGTNAEYSNG